MKFFRKLFGTIPEPREETPVSSSAKIVGRVPTEPVIAVFIPRMDFFSEEFKSQYVAGMKYYLREGNAKLAAQMGIWREEEKIDIL